MTFLNPEKYLIVQYRPGSGGKFLCLALTTISKIAHWNPLVECGKVKWHDYVQSLWTPCNKFLWLAHEPITSWDLTFFSRTMPRGIDLSLAEFNSLCKQHASDYFKKIWYSDKIILDFLNKEQIPIWWKDSRFVRLDVDTHSKNYQKRLLDKLYTWDDENKIGSCMMDKPMPEQKYQNSVLFNNKWQYGPFENSDDWLNWVLENDTRINFKMPDADIWMDDLLEFDKVLNLIKSVSTNLKSDFDVEALKFLHDYWKTKY